MAKGRTGPANVVTAVTALPYDEDGWRTRVLERSLESAKQRSLDRSQAFIGAAIELLREKGEGFTLQEVSDRAGFSLRLFYQHFGGKHDLLLAVLEEELRTAMTVVQAKLADEPDPIQRLVILLNMFLAAADEPSAHNLTLLKYELELVATHPQEVAMLHAPETRVAQGIIADGLKTGVLHVASPEDGAYFVVALKRVYNQSKLLGTAFGVALPDPHEFVRFCIEGLGGSLQDAADAADGQAAAMTGTFE